ncbi:MAG TPA: DUF3703 domain-containing protein [Rhizorhapis sp.]
MVEAASDRFAAFIAEEYRAADGAEKSGRIEQAWCHLERAHVVSQTHLWPHMQSHWKMLQLAVRLRDGREVVGQLFRLALAPLGNLTGRLPIGNTGRSNVSAFRKMQIPADLERFVR